MEFIKVLKELYEGSNFNDVKNPNKLINHFLSVIKCEEDSIKFHQLNYLLSIPDAGNFISKLFQAKKKNTNMSKIVGEIVTDFDIQQVSPHLYAYFVYCTLKSLNVPSAEIKWINPATNSLRNSTLGLEQSFGHGLFIEEIFDYEIARTTIVKCLKEKRYVTIPQGVTEIAEGAFKHLQTMEFLTFPESIEQLNKRTFSYAPELNKVIFPKNVKSIPDSFLQSCPKLSVVVAREVTSVGANSFEGSNISLLRNIGDGKLEYIGSNAFKDCSEITKLDLFSLKEIGTTPFANCFNISELNIKVTKEMVENKIQISDLFTKNSLEMSNYPYLTNLVVEVKDGIIPNGFFENCSSLESIKIIGEITHIGERAFKGCVRLENLDIDFKGLTLEDSVFENCTKLTNFPKFSNVEKIKNNVFKECTCLQELIFYKPIIELLNGCFHNCFSLKKITMKLIYDTLGDYCFSGCTALIDFSFMNNIKKIGSYALQSIELPTNFELPTKISSIASNAFDNCTFNDVVCIPDDCLIDESAFSNIKPVSKLVIENLQIKSTNNKEVQLFKLFESTLEKFNEKFVNLKYLEIDTDIVPNNTFTNWVNIEEVTLGERLEVIGNSSFKDCSKLKTLDIFATNITIEPSAFENCSILTRISTLQNDILKIEGIYDLSVCNSIKKDAFKNCNLRVLYLAINKDTKEDAYILEDVFKQEVQSENFLQTINIKSTSGKLLNGLFANCPTLKNITVTGVITKLSDNLFEGCINLENLVMEYEGAKVNKYAFANCPKLVKYPNFNNVKIIEEKAFLGCTSLTSIRFEKRISEIGESAFEGCKNLKVVNMEFYGTKLEANTFKDCHLINSYDFIKSVEVLKSNCLSNLILSNKFNIPESVKYIESNAFYGSTLSSDLVLCNNVTYEQESFVNTKGITKLIFNNAKFFVKDKEIFTYKLFNKDLEVFNKKYDSIKSIELNTNNISEDCFKGWKSISNVIFTHKVEMLPNCCFEDCSSIEQVNLPYVNINLSSRVFSNCTNLSKVTFFDNYLEEELDILPTKVYNNCKKLEDIQIYLNQNILDNKVRLISYFSDNDELFNKNITKLKSIHLVNSIKEVPKEFFKNCRKTTNISILNEVNKLNDSVFENCTSLEKIDINFTGDTIPNKLFSECNNLVNIFNYDSVEKIGNYSFNNCKKITKFDFASDITTIGESAFSNCSNLLDINMKFIGEILRKETFANCKKLIRTPKFVNLEHLDDTSFIGCKELKTIYLTALKNTTYSKLFSSLKSIDKLHYNSTDIPDNFFKNTKNINEIIFEYNIKSIGSSAFENCSNISKITNLDDIEFIGDNAFKNSNLSSITIPQTITSYGLGIFADCLNLIEINIPIRFDYIGNIFSTIKTNNSKELVQVGNGIEKKYYMPKSLLKIVINSGEIEEGIFSNVNIELFINVSLTKIKKNTFYNCGDVKLPYMKDIKEIDDNAFTNARVEDLELNNITSIKESAFENATIKSILLGEKISTMYASSFKDFHYDNFIIRDNKNYKFESNILLDIKNATILNVFNCPEMLLIPDEVEVINSDTFINKNIKVLDTNNVRVIKTKAFSNCNLEKITFTNVEKFSENILSNCKKITKLELPFIGSDIKTTKSLDYLFDFDKTEYDTIIVNGGSITSDTFNSLTKVSKLDLLNVKKNCFEDDLFKNININELVLPKTLDDIKDHAFDNVVIDNVVCSNQTISYKENCICVKDKIVYCTKNYINNLIINDSIKKVSDIAFKNCETITNLEITNNKLKYTGLFNFVKTITNLTISNINEKPYLIFNDILNNIKEITYISDEIAEGFFTNIIKLDKLTFTKYNLFDISMFSEDKEKYASFKIKKILLDSLIFKQELTEVNDNTFKYFTINNINIKPSSKYSTDNNLLFNIKDKSLIYAGKKINGSIVVPEFIHYTKEEAFKDCSELTEVKFININTIEKNTFDNCSKLHTIIINKNCEYINESILKRCSNFKYIETPFIGNTISNTKNLDYFFGSGVCDTSIDTIKVTSQSTISNTFTNQTSVESIILGNGVTKVKFGSFNGCKKLSKIYLNPNIDTIDEYVFDGCNRSLKAYIFKKAEKSWPEKWCKLNDKKMFSTIKVIYKKTDDESFV